MNANDIEAGVNALFEHVDTENKRRGMFSGPLPRAQYEEGFRGYVCAILKAVNRACAPQQTKDDRMTLPERCRAQARSMDEEGWYVCANVLAAAAEQIEELEDRLSAEQAAHMATMEHCNEHHIGDER